MKPRFLSIFLAVVALPFVGRAAEAAFFSQPGKYTLSPETALAISADESSRQPKAMLTFTSGGGSGITISTEHPDDPFLVYWDVATQTLWWGTAQSVGYLDVHTPHSGRSGSHPRLAPAHREQFPPTPAVFAAELDHTVPVHP